MWLPSLQKSLPETGFPCLPHNTPHHFEEEWQKKRKYSKARLPCTQKLLFPLPLSKCLWDTRHRYRRFWKLLSVEGWVGWADRPNVSSPGIKAVTGLWRRELINQTRGLGHRVLKGTEGEACKPYALFSFLHLQPLLSSPCLWHHQGCLCLAWDSSLLSAYSILCRPCSHTLSPRSLHSLIFPLSVERLFLWKQPKVDNLTSLNYISQPKMVTMFF